MKIVQILSNKKSRPVTDADVLTVVEAIDPMVDICNTKIGPYVGGVALAHCQIERKDPMRFYVTKEGKVFINPVILRRSNHPVTNEEGCLSYIHRYPKPVERSNKVEIEYQVLENAEYVVGDPHKYKLSQILTTNLSGLQARIVQHEIDHFEGINIYQ